MNQATRRTLRGSNRLATSSRSLATVRVRSQRLLEAHAARIGVAKRVRLVADLGDGRVRAQLAARRWQRPCADVIVMHNGPLTDEQRTIVCLLAAPPGSALFGLSAALHDGLKGFRPDRLSIVVPASSRNPTSYALPVPADWGVTLHWSTQMAERDVAYASSPRRTRMPRSIVDAASERVAVRRSRVIVLSAVQQRRVTTAALWEALSRRGRCRNRATIAEAILDATGGIESLPEGDFDRIRRGLGLPEPARQVRRARVDDGHYFLDTEWPEWGVRSEVHGIPHSRVESWDHDLLRQNDVTIEGSGLLIFSSYAIRHLQQRVGDQLSRMFRQQGWRG